MVITPNYAIVLLPIYIPLGILALTASTVLLQRQVRGWRVKRAKRRTEEEQEALNWEIARHLYAAAIQRGEEAAKSATNALFYEVETALETGKPVKEPEVLAPKQITEVKETPSAPSQDAAIKELTCVPQVTYDLAAQLSALGIRSIAALAARDPATLARRLRLYPKFMQRIIENAKAELKK